MSEIIPLGGKATRVRTKGFVTTCLHVFWMVTKLDDRSSEVISIKRRTTAGVLGYIRSDVIDNSSIVVMTND